MRSLFCTISNRAKQPVSRNQLYEYLKGKLVRMPLNYVILNRIKSKSERTTGTRTMGTSKLFNSAGVKIFISWSCIIINSFFSVFFYSWQPNLYCSSTNYYNNFSPFRFSMNELPKYFNYFFRLSRDMQDDF